MHVSLDIETMSTSKRAVVLSIGAWTFTPGVRDRSHGEGFYVTLDRASQVEGGRHVDRDTCMWWLTHTTDEALRATFDGEGFPVEGAIQMLDDWLKSVPPIEGVWCKGPAFDGAVLEDLCEWADVPCPITYRQWRDVRTILDAADIVSQKDLGEGNRWTIRHDPRIPHLALEDAIAQGLDVAAALRRIEG